MTDYRFEYNNGIVTVSSTYKMDSSKMKKLDTKVKLIVSKIVKSDTDITTKERVIHDWIANNTEYDNSHSIYEHFTTLEEHVGVCEGHTLLAQKMFEIASIKSKVVEGTIQGEKHSLNLVQTEDGWRHVDITWDDPVTPDGSDIIKHDYFNVKDNIISRDHSWDKSKYPHTS